MHMLGRERRGVGPKAVCGRMIVYRGYDSRGGYGTWRTWRGHGARQHVGVDGNTRCSGQRRERSVGKGGRDAAKGKEIRAAMEKARNRRRDADGFHEIVQGSAKLRRACGVENEGTREATEGDMRTMWKAFAKYVEADGRDAGEMQTRNLGVITRQEGRRSKLEWKIETEQDVFYGGREVAPQRHGHGQEKGAQVRAGGKRGRRRNTGRRIISLAG